MENEKEALLNAGVSVLPTKSCCESARICLYVCVQANFDVSHDGVSIMENEKEALLNAGVSVLRTKSCFVSACLSLCLCVCVQANMFGKMVISRCFHYGERFAN